MAIRGLVDLAKTLDQAQRAIAELDGELGTVSFDPEDPASIERAVQSVEAMIDQRLQPYASNAIVAQLQAGLKETYREAIVDRAQQARLSSDGSKEDGTENVDV